MREQWARRIAFLTGFLVLLFAIVFALIQNPSNDTDNIILEISKDTSQHKLVAPIRLDIERVEAGRQIYKQQACARCHSINGKGNPRYPLDNIGIKYSTKELQDWITGAETLQNQVPERVFNLKQTYRTLSDRDIENLILYLQSQASPILNK